MSFLEESHFRRAAAESNAVVVGQPFQGDGHFFVDVVDEIAEIFARLIERLFLSPNDRPAVLAVRGRCRLLTINQRNLIVLCLQCVRQTVLHG